MGKESPILTGVASLLGGILLGARVSTPDALHIDPPPKGGYAMLFPGADFLKRELPHRQQIGLAAYDDRQCQLAWSAARDQPDGCADVSVIATHPTQTTSPLGH